MKNIIHLIALVGLMVSIPIHAESKAVHYSKKAAKVAWHSAEVGAGLVLAAMIVGMLQGVYYKGKETFKNADGKIDSNLMIALEVSTVTIGASSLLSHGFSGLNNELEITDRIKRLYEKRHKAEKVS